MSWNIGDYRNLFLKLKTKLGLYQVELKNEDSPENITLTMVETQQLPWRCKNFISKSDALNKNSYKIWSVVKFLFSNLTRLEIFAREFHF